MKSYGQLKISVSHKVGLFLHAKLEEPSSSPPSSPFGIVSPILPVWGIWEVSVETQLRKEAVMRTHRFSQQKLSSFLRTDEVHCQSTRSQHKSANSRARVDTRAAE